MMQERYEAVTEWSLSVLVVVFCLTCALVSLVMNCSDGSVEESDDDDIGTEKKRCCRKKKTKKNIPVIPKPQPGTKEYKIMRGLKRKRKDPIYDTLRELDSAEIFDKQTERVEENVSRKGLIHCLGVSTTLKFVLGYQYRFVSD